MCPSHPVLLDGKLTENLCQDGQGKRVLQPVPTRRGFGAQWDEMSGEGLAVEQYPTSVFSFPDFSGFGSSLD